MCESKEMLILGKVCCIKESGCTCVRVRACVCACLCVCLRMRVPVRAAAKGAAREGRSVRAQS